MLLSTALEPNRNFGRVGLVGLSAPEKQDGFANIA